MNIELINKEFILKETQYTLEHDYEGMKSRLSAHNYLGRKGQRVDLVDVLDDLAIVRNAGSSISYYTLYSNLI